MGRPWGLSRSSRRLARGVRSGRESSRCSSCVRATNIGPISTRSSCARQATPQRASSVAMPGNVVSLRLDRHQRARDEDIPTISVLVGTRSLAVERWDAWSEQHERPRVWLEVDGISEPLQQRIAAAILDGRPVVREVAAFVARATGEALAELESRMPSLGRPERAELLDKAATAAGLPDAARLAEQLLASHTITSIDGGDMRAVVTLLRMMSPRTRPGLLLATTTVE